MRTVIPLFLLSLAAFAADSDFNGRWDIKPATGAKAWWLEINGAGTPEANGTFISAYGGDLNKIDKIEFKDGQMRLTFNRPGRNGQKPPALVLTARLVDGKLVGESFNEGREANKTAFTGVRAPVIKDKDDGSWKPGKPVKLFNGKDLSGWLPMVQGKELGWKVENGIMKNVAGANNLVSEQKFWNFKLHAEFRLGEHTNSGLGLRDRYEIQILEDYGKAPNSHSAGALYSRVAPTENASKPAGEWQTYDITLIGRTLTLVFNGKKVLDKVQVDGLTAIAHDADEGLPGPLSVQGDHGPVEIRDLTITPLTKK